MKWKASMNLLGLLTMGLLASGRSEEKPFVHQELELREDYTETAFGLNMEMVYVKGGEFTMEEIAEQRNDAFDSEKLVRTVKMDSYYIGKYEVTQAQWEKVMGTSLKEQRDKANPDGSLYGEGDNYPMYYVSWDEAQEFCKKLSEKTGKKYVLPTEAQWEYAACGGVHKITTQFAGSNDIDEVAWYKGNSGTLDLEYPDYGTHPVGKKKANALGIYDMSGNVGEWCLDRYSDDRYEKNDDYNPHGTTSGAYRVLRGGSWVESASFSLVSANLIGRPTVREVFLGFRVAVLL